VRRWAAATACLTPPQAGQPAPDYDQLSAQLRAKEAQIRMTGARAGGGGAAWALAWAA
jgi:hypothetical protein